MCETYIIIKDMKQAQEIASYILQASHVASLRVARCAGPTTAHLPSQEPGCLTTEELLEKYKHAASPHFDPKVRR